MGMMRSSCKGITDAAVLVVLDFGFWSRLRDLENRDEKKDELPRCNYPIAIKAHFLIKKLKLSQCAGQGSLRRKINLPWMVNGCLPFQRFQRESAFLK